MEEASSCQNLALLPCSLQLQLPREKSKKQPSFDSEQVYKHSFWLNLGCLFGSFLLRFIVIPPFLTGMNSFHSINSISLGFSVQVRKKVLEELGGHIWDSCTTQQWFVCSGLI